MRKFLKVLMFLALAVPGFSWATLSQVATPVPIGPVEQSSDARFDLSTLSGTGSANTSIAIQCDGYGLIQFKIIAAAYRGTFKIQGSMDNSTYVTIHESSNDSVAVTETYYWQSADGWKQIRVTGDPNGSNAGTLGITGTLVSKANTPANAYTGYYGLTNAPVELAASALVTEASTDIYWHSGGDGVQVEILATATNSGNLVGGLYSVSPTGQLTFVGATTAITAVTTTAGSRILVSLPGWATASNSTFPMGGSRWRLNFAETGTSTTYSVAARPLKK